MVGLDFSKLLGYLEESLISLSLISSHLSTEYQELLLKVQIHTSYMNGNYFPKDLALGTRGEEEKKKKSNWEEKM